MGSFAPPAAVVTSATWSFSCLSVFHWEVAGRQGEVASWKGFWRGEKAGSVLSITAHMARGWTQPASTLAAVWYDS